MSIEWLIFTGLTYLLIVILADKSVESQNLFGELMKVLISGYLGYLVRVAQENMEYLLKKRRKDEMIKLNELDNSEDLQINDD